MYTLEKHLETSAIESSQFELISSIWKLNKKLIPNAQNAISFNFPHYSLHEKSHSETIIKNIESFLGEERIKKLSPSDAWLILMSAFTHDLGMVVFHTALEKKWIEEDFQDYLQTLTEKTFDKDLQKAAQLLIDVQNTIGQPDANSLNLPLEIRKAVILVTADYFRRSHHQRSKEIISGVDEEFFRLISGFNLNGVPNRFSNVLAEVAFAHGIDFYSVLERLDYTADGLGNDKMHPRFVACLLRLGDLLDVDDKRFNIFSEKVFSSSLPKTSQLHYEKHASTRHILICPSSIEITVDCKSDEVYRVAREWFDWLQIEVENQSREWAQIAPANLLGMPPTISRGKIKVLYKSVEPKRELMNLRFNISNEKVFEIFEGAAIYERPEYVFLRELVQNAFDATKIQIWKVINSGVYDFIIRDHNNLPENASHEEIIKSISFPLDIPKQILDSFQVSLKIYWETEENDSVVFEVVDHGTGISEKDLIRMTHRVGESRSKDLDFQKFKKTMPYWLMPTGAFGIGLQSLFLVAKSFRISTKTDNDSHEIEFYSSKKGEYSRIIDSKPIMQRGTSVKTVIPVSRCKELFSAYNQNVFSKYDYFSDKYGFVFIHNLKNYIEKEFLYVKSLCKLPVF